MSIVRENLMTRKGYTPYCGNQHCRFNMPRTRYIGGQFQCGCGWRSSFDDEFIEAYEAKWASPAPQPNVLPPVVTGQMEIEPDVTAADLGVNAEPPEPDDLREEMRLAAASIRQWMPETLPANEAGQIHFARLLAESAAEAIEQFLATTEGSTDA